MKHEWIVTAEGRDRTVVVEGPLPAEPGEPGEPGAREGRFRVTIDGEAREVDARPIRPGTWSLVIAGRSFLVDLDRRRSGIAASVGASEALLQVEDALHRRLAAAAQPRGGKSRGEAIRAPIAGKVVKVLVAAGDTVAAGSAVLVLEAMKMENELVAERGGTVAKINAQPGQAVETGELLIELS